MLSDSRGRGTTKAHTMCTRGFCSIGHHRQPSLAQVPMPECNGSQGWGGGKKALPLWGNGPWGLGPNSLSPVPRLEAQNVTAFHGPPPPGRTMGDGLRHTIHLALGRRGCMGGRVRIAWSGGANKLGCGQPLNTSGTHLAVKLQGHGPPCFRMHIIEKARVH